MMSRCSASVRRFLKRRQYSSAHVVAAHRFEQIQMLFEIGDLEEAVVLAAANQQYRLALVLPVGGIGLIDVDTAGRCAQRRRRHDNHTP